MPQSRADRRAGKIGGQAARQSAWVVGEVVEPPSKKSSKRKVRGKSAKPAASTKAKKSSKKANRKQRKRRSAGQSASAGLPIKSTARKRSPSKPRLSERDWLQAASALGVALDGGTRDVAVRVGKLRLQRGGFDDQVERALQALVAALAGSRPDRSVRDATKEVSHGKEGP